MAQEIYDNRMNSWNHYYERLNSLADKGVIDIPFIPDDCIHNAHMFYIKLRDIEQRTKFIDYMKENGIYCVFHYIPLHSALTGRRFGRFSGEDIYTTRESERLVRLPMYYGLKSEDADEICDRVVDFCKKL